jgi:2-oxoglutarate ferredoxin oxidoreductase subunit alpha
MGGFDYALAIGGAAGQGMAVPGSILSKIFVRRGLHLYNYTAYQSIIRGGHILMTIRVGEQRLLTHGDKIDMLIPLNQDTMDRHLHLLGPGGRVIYNEDTIQLPDTVPDGVVLCPFPFKEVSNGSRNKLVQNTIALGVIMQQLGIEFDDLAGMLVAMFTRKGKDVVEQNVAVAQAGYDYAVENFPALTHPAPKLEKGLAVWTGNDALAMGGATAGVKFYCAYPMSPATGVLHWMAKNARRLGIMVRQVEDEIAVANMAIGAGFAGCRTMCATSGGGFALMTEAIGAAAQMEIPVVFINVQRAGPSTGVPTKTEQSDLWQMLGASAGDFPRLICGPLHAEDAYNTMPELFNLVDRYQCPGIVVSDLLISEGTSSVDPDDIDLHPTIDRGELILKDAEEDTEYKRYKITESGVSPRAVPGLRGYNHVASTDEHDEDGTLLSDEFTNPHKRRNMVEKRARKFDGIEDIISAPELEGPADAEVTLVGWGSTYGVVHEAIEQLEAEGVTCNHLPIKWIVPFHSDAVRAILESAKKTIVIENTHSGQFYRFMRSEIGLQVDQHIRKYDGEPFMPYQVVDGVKEILAGKTEIYVPTHPIMV